MMVELMMVFVVKGQEQDKETGVAVHARGPICLRQPCSGASLKNVDGEWNVELG